MKQSGLLFIIFFALIPLSCDVDENSYLPPFSGTAGEMILVVEDEFWEGEVGEVLRDGFQKPVPGLDHNEASFSIMQYADEHFGNLLSLHRNVVRINIKDIDANEAPRHKIQKNVWANEQLVIEVYARNKEDFIAFFNENVDQYVALINQEEQVRLKSRFYNVRDAIMKTKLEEKYKLGINVPQDFEIVKETEDFIWVRRLMQKYLQGENFGGAYHDIDENIFIYSYPYTDTSMFSAEYQLMMRDSICKEFVPGNIMGSYMASELDYFDPVYLPTELNENRALEIRGLWKLDGVPNAFMGGPFIGLTCYDAHLQRIIYIEGNVYAPKFSKREYIRELEAMIYSIKPVK